MSDEEDTLYIVEKYLRNTQKSGATNVMAECPFHMSDNPGGSRTLAISLTTGLFHCFSCKTSGNFERLLQLLKAPTSFITAHQRLIESQKINRKREATFSLKRTASEPVSEAILGIFHWCPTELLEAGFEEETLKHFEVGVDKTHNRTTFPLRDLEGGLVGVFGRDRTGDPAVPRHKLYVKEYKVWGLPAVHTQKDSIIWNFHEAVKEHDAANLVVVEGPKACMWVWQSGIRSVVALLGSSLSLEQETILSLFGKEIVLMFDGDSAGTHGMLSAGRRLSNAVNVKVAALPEKAQPDSLTPEKVKSAVSSATLYQLWASERKRKNDRRRISW